MPREVSAFLSFTEIVALVASTQLKASHFFGLREGHQYSNHPSSRIRVSCVACDAAGTEREKDQLPGHQRKENR